MQTSSAATAADPIQTAIDDAKWYHDFEVVPGYWTGGQFRIGEKGLLDGYKLYAPLDGMVIADVGAWDGAITFELETRGARAIGCDIQDPDKTAFNTAKRLRGAEAGYIQTSVYDIDKHGITFDAVVFNGVFYHLKYPILAFERINAALKEGGRLYFSGEIFMNYAETLTGEPVTEGLRDLAMSEIPMSLVYPGRYKGASNWHIPNFACVKGWLAAAGFELERHWFQDGKAERPTLQSVLGVARKVGGVEDEHPLVGVTMWNPALGH